MESDAVRLVEVRGLPLLPPLLWPKRDSISAKKQPFWIKNRAFWAGNGEKTGFAVTNQLTGIKSQPIDSL
jgi:hypothetical protein